MRTNPNPNPYPNPNPNPNPNPSPNQVESEHWRERITEEYVMLIETDHMIMMPPPNRATPEMPVASSGLR